MSTSREVSRDALKALLTTALVGTGLPVKTVTASKVDNLEGLTPLVAILSGGTLRKRITFQGDKPTFYFEVQVWVSQAQAGWTNAQAEDALDEIESIIAATYDTARNTADWSTVDYESRSTVTEAKVSGNLYYLERVPTVVKLKKS